jgi:hypothetical protein
MYELDDSARRDEGFGFDATEPRWKMAAAIARPTWVGEFFFHRGMDRLQTFAPRGEGQGALAVACGEP